MREADRARVRQQMVFAESGVTEGNQISTMLERAFQLLNYDSDNRDQQNGTHRHRIILKTNFMTPKLEIPTPKSEHNNEYPFETRENFLNHSQPFIQREVLRRLKAKWNFYMLVLVQ